MRLKLPILMILGVLLPPPQIAWAGMCVDGDEVYLDCLENEATCKIFNLSQDFSLQCVAMTVRPLMDWGIPVQKQIYSRYTRSPLRDRILSICEPLLESPRLIILDNRRRSYRVQAAEILATYGYHNVGGRDLFEILVSDDKERHFYALGALGDQRAIPYLEKWFYAANVPGKAGERAGVINALYHVPGNQAIQLATEFLVVEHDKENRDRLKRVIQRDK